MNDISVKNVKIGFEVGDDVLTDVSFEIYTGEHVGLIGRNGAGKTTLFRCITGELSPDSGTVTIAPGLRVGVLSQIPVFPESFTGEDVLKSAQDRVTGMGEELRRIEAGMANGVHDDATLRRYDELSHEFTRLGGYELDRLRDTVANGLGIPRAQRLQPFSELSGGEKTRMNLARLIIEDTDILLLDEPTNHLDMGATLWLEDYISRFKGTVLAISHDRWFLDRAINRIIEIEDGEAELYSGSYSFYAAEKEKRREEQLRRYEREQAEIQRLTETARIMHQHNTEHLNKRAFSIEKRIERLRTTERPKTQSALHAKFGETEFRADEVMEIRGLKKSFGDRVLFRDVNLQVRGGERIALIGDNGTGKSTFLKMVMDEEEPDEGLIRLGPSVRIAYLPQLVQFEDEHRTVLETMMYEGKCTMQEARDRLGGFLFRGEDVYTEVSRLSGGEKSRLKLCMVMKRSMNLLILDEPTNHLDIPSREWMEGAISEYGEALLFVSHDRFFIDKFATRVWEIRDGVLRDYKCGFKKYLELREREESVPQPVVTKEKKEKPKKGGSANNEKLLKKIEREISQLEEKLAENEQQSEEFSSDYERLMELASEKEALEAELSEKYARWEELMS